MMPGRGEVKGGEGRGGEGIVLVALLFLLERLHARSSGPNTDEQRRYGRRTTAEIHAMRQRMHHTLARTKDGGGGAGIRCWLLHLNS